MSEQHPLSEQQPSTTQEPLIDQASPAGQEPPAGQETPSAKEASADQEPRQPQQQQISPRRRLQTLLAIPDSQRTEDQWDEINELEISLAPGNRADAPGGMPGLPPPRTNPGAGGNPRPNVGHHRPGGGKAAGGKPGGGNPGGGNAGGKSKKPFRKARKKPSPQDVT